MPAITDHRREIVRTPPLILIVEDNPESLDILQARLTANNYEVITAPDGEAGLAMAREKQPDLILLDIMMPKMDGIEVCRHIRADPSLPIYADHYGHCQSRFKRRGGRSRSWWRRIPDQVFIDRKIHLKMMRYISAIWNVRSLAKM
jgi:CheY-like chemotaxis protein